MAERLILKSDSQQTLDDYLMYLRHLAAYRFVLSKFNTSRIIDLGCGTSYGTELMADSAGIVVGLDRASEALPYSTKTKDKLWFFVADVCQLPFSDSSFNLAVSFQVIEHIRNVHFYLREAHRVLSKDGMLVISTPNRLLRLWPLERPWNPYHVKEYSQTTLRHLLKEYFSEVKIFGLQAIPEIEFKERKRLRQAWWWHYKTLILENIQKLPLGEQGIRVTRKLKRELFPLNKVESSTKIFIDNHLFRDIYSSESFWVSDSDVNKRMDLIAVCRK
jgi:ubiquinone/menaquinone biosynthesis C-methylase UbiE